MPRSALSWVVGALNQLSVGHAVLLLAHPGPIRAMAQQFSSPHDSLVPVGTCCSPGCFGVCSSLPSKKVIPVDVNPQAALEEQVSLLVPSAVLGTRVWAEDLGLGKRRYSGLPGSSFHLLLLG